MKDILIVVSPSGNENQIVYKEIRKEISGYGKEAQQFLYTTFLLTGPKSFERAMSIVHIADQHSYDTAVFEIESVLKHPVDMNPE